MAKIERYQGNLEAFASDALAGERTIFDSTASGDTLTENINASYKRGWGVVAVSENPTKQDFNALNYVNSQLAAYLHQMGVAEWDSAQEYHTGSICNISGILYRSRTDTNIGNNPVGDPVNWQDLFTAAGVTFDDSGVTFTAADVQAAIEALNDLFGSQASELINGLGTASTADTTTSSTDTTVGRVLKVGDHGVGTIERTRDLLPSSTNQRRTVYALCELTNTNPNYNSYSAGSIVTHRYNALNEEHEATATFHFAKHYNTTKPIVTLETTVDGVFRACTFTYNGIKYAGVEHYFISAAQVRSFNVTYCGTFEPFGITYYDTEFDVAIDTEINGSLNFDDFEYVNQGLGYQQGNILGTVSQAAGVPTGAIIERGSNTDGEYVKYADGTMICSVSKKITGGFAVYGWVYRTESLDFVWPHVFAELQSFSHGNRTTIKTWVGLGTNGVNITGGSVASYRGIPSTVDAHVMVTGIGTWY